MKSFILTFSLSSMVMLGTSFCALAADPSVVEFPDSGENKDILEILEMGGFMMYPLALVVGDLCGADPVVFLYHSS